jgi:hypothetical protein
MVSAHLEYLELTLCAKDLMRGVTGQGGTGGGFFESLIGAGSFTSSVVTTTTTVTSTSSSPSDSTSPDTPTSKSLSHQLSTETLHSLQSAVGSLTLPNLTSLKLTLDNVTCLVISTWGLPALKHVSMIVSDFSYAHEGFARFFEVHGGQVEELELGHSTGAIEDFWLTVPPQHVGGQPAHPTNANAALTNQQTEWRFGSTRVPLAEWCPNLKTFICSADAEWNWESPDWIAPHVLLPTHPGVEVIGVRDIEKRIHEALGRAKYRDRVALSEGRRFVGLDEASGSGGEGVNDPFFALLEQLGSLVNSDVFPALKYVRDLSPQSRVMRETGMVGVRDVEMQSIGSFAPGWGDNDFDEDKEEDDSEEEEQARSASVSGIRRVFGTTTSMLSAGFGTGGHGRGYSTFGQGGLVGLWAAMAQNKASSSSPPASSSGQPTGKAPRKMLERQQGIRVLRFWKNVLTLFGGGGSGQGVYLEDCDGCNVTLAGLRRAAAEGRLKV